MRHPDDAYLTPQPLANAITFALARYIEAPQTVLEPSAGEGAFVRAAWRSWPTAQVQAVEPRYEAGSRIDTETFHSTLEDFFERQADRMFDLALGNPPYMRAEAHLALCRAHAKYVAFLLRLSFLGSRRRSANIFSKPDFRFLIPVAQRPSFTATGTDASEYGVFVWQRGYTGRAEILPHLWVNE